MQISFKSLVRPRRAAKALSEQVPGTKLSESQNAVARMCGYDSWSTLKHAAEQPDAQASPDDEDLPAPELQSRLEFQAQQIRAVFGNTLAQARELVRLTSPTARAPVRPPAEPATGRARLTGASVYMPSLFTRFSPSYPEVFGLLQDVDVFRIDFVQPDEISPVSQHLAEEVTFTFSNGRKLSLQGVYFWKFLDTVPREFLDERGEVLSPNPYSREPIEQMLHRLRTAYSFMFSEAPCDTFGQEVPVWVELDLVYGTLARRNPISLRDAEETAFWNIFEREADESAQQLQAVVDKFMVETLTGPRVELKLVNKGGRGSTVLGNAYVPSSWEGTGHWTMQDLLMELSPVQRHPSGCGGNLHYRDLFEQAIQGHFHETLYSACRKVLANQELYAAMRTQLELATMKKTASAEAKAQQLADGLLATNLRLNLSFSFASVLKKRQESRTFASWRPDLTENPAQTRPSVRIDELLKKHRSAA